MSGHLFYLTGVGCFSTVLLNLLANIFNATANPSVYGKLIFLFSIIGYAGSIPSFWRAGKEYKKMVENKERNAAASASAQGGKVALA